jgi:hypothetical protein
MCRLASLPSANVFVAFSHYVLDLHGVRYDFATLFYWNASYFAMMGRTCRYCELRTNVYFCKMIIARQKRKENIAEYLFYMWQVEDLIRACGFDIEAIRHSVIDRYDQPEDVKRQIVRWYEELIEMMRIEGVKEKGHIQLNKNVLMELSELHLYLLKDPKEITYGALYYRTLPCIVQLRTKSGGIEIPEIETCFTAVYGYLLLRLQKKGVNPETLEAVRQINTFLNFLAEKYRAQEHL